MSKHSDPDRSDAIVQRMGGGKAHPIDLLKDESDPQRVATNAAFAERQGAGKITEAKRSDKTGDIDQAGRSRTVPQRE